jgi:hypothetical protein
MLLTASRQVTFRLFVVLSAWFFVGGVAWMDSCDLNDEPASPLAGMAQAVESDVDEVKYDILEIALTPGLLGQAADLVTSQRLSSAVSSEAGSNTSDCPLYQRLSTYRI